MSRVIGRVWLSLWLAVLSVILCRFLCGLRVGLGVLCLWCRLVTWLGLSLVTLCL